MKKILPVLGICSILYLSGINSPTAIAGDSYNIQVKKGKGHVYNLSENERNKQLHKVAKTAEKEDAWLYVAGKWYDIGQSEEGNLAYIPLEYIIDLLKKNHKGEKEAKFVHIHPKAVVKDGASPPSVYDLFVHEKLKKMLRDKLQMKLTSEVYDGKGVWTYDITDNLEEDIHNAVPGDFSKWETLKDIVTKEAILISGNKSLSRKEKIESYISAVKKLGVILSYHSLDK